MNAIIERWIRTCRTELLDRTMTWNQPHLLHALREYQDFYNQHRPHRALHAAAPQRALPAPIAEPHALQHLNIRRQDHLQGDGLNRMGEDGKHIAVTEANSPRLTAEVTPLAIDPVSWPECQEHSYDNGDNAYWFKNKYNACRLELFTLTYRELVNGVITVVGKTTMVIELKATAVLGESTVHFDMRMRDFKHFDRTHREWLMTVQLWCTNADSSRTSTCTESSGQHTVYRKPILEWESLAGTEFSWSKNTATTANQDPIYRAEMRGFFAVGLSFSLESPVQPPDTSQSPVAILRCDSASYVGGSKCVFPRVASVLQFSASDSTMSESTQFIRDAQTDITLTKPGIPGKKVPGVLGDAPLHRLHSSYDTKNTIKASRRKVPKTCRLYWGQKYTLNKKRECDEYPFATTYENSAKVNTHTVYDYAVRAIKKEHNGAAGTAYGIWLTADRILDGDPFFVRVGP
jgi:hypothetical protein